MNAPVIDLGRVREMRAVAEVEPSLLTLWADVEAARIWAFADGAERPWSLYQEMAFHTQALDDRAFEWLLRKGVDHPALFGDADGGGWPLVTGRAERTGRTFTWCSEGGARALVFLVRDRDGIDDDILCWWPREDRVASLSGAPLLGAESLGNASEPVEVHVGVLEWLRAGRHGVVIVNRNKAVPLLRAAKALVVDDLAFGEKLERALTLRAPKILVREAA